MNKNYFFLIILIIFAFEVNSSEKKVFIKKTVNEHIITNIDIDNEINFITALNTNLVSVYKKKINEYAENNLVNEKIKISELSKFYEINNSESLPNKIIMRFAKRLGINELVEFKRGDAITKKTSKPGNIPVIAGGKKVAYYFIRKE